MAKTDSNNWQTRIIHTFAEVENIRSAWESLQASETYPTIDANVDRQLSVMQAFECTPLILLLEQNNQPRAMIIGRQEKLTLPVKLGYKTLMKPKLNGMSVVYGGVLGQPDEQISSLLIRELMKHLRKKEIDVISFNHLKVDSIFYQQLLRIVPFLFRNNFPVIEPHWRMSMPGGLEEFLASRSKNTRKDFRRTLNRLPKKFPDKVKICVYKTLTEVPRAIEDAVYISRNTYHIPLGSGFVDTFQTHALLKMAAAKGWLRLYVLYIDNEPVAFEYILKNGRIGYGEATAYDPKWQKWNVGTFTLLKAIECLSEEGDVDYLDFGFGGAQYKRSLCNDFWQEARETYLFSHRVYPIFIKVIYTVVTTTNIFLKYILTKSGMFNNVKRKWRNFLQKSKSK